MTGLHSVAETDLGMMMMKVIDFESTIINAEEYTEGSSGSPRFRVEAYNGGKMDIKGYDLPIIVKTDGVKMESQVKVLMQHDSERVIGHMENMSFENGRISGTAVLSMGNKDDMQRMHAASKEGFQHKLSVGLMPVEMMELGDGDVIDANGSQAMGPAFYVTESNLREISFVTFPADSYVCRCCQRKTNK